MERRLLVLLAETSVHAGGPDSVALVDLPIQREATTKLPVIWGQSLKGALRQSARDAGWTETESTAVFGSPPPRRADAPTDDPATDAADGGVAADEAAGDGVAAEQQAGGVDGREPGGDLVKGSLSVGDAQLVAMPAATLRNAFAWVTGPLLLSRLRRKINLTGVPGSAGLDVPASDGQAAGTAGWSGRQVFGGFVENVLDRPAAGRVGTILGELACPADPADAPAFGYTREKMSTDLVCVADTLMAGLSQLGTDIVARVQLDPAAKTVANGPFYTENLPAETVLAAVLAGERTHLDRLAALLDGKPLQLGGDETVGKGLLWCRIHTASALQAVLDRAALDQAGVDPPGMDRPGMDWADEPAAGAPAAAPATGGGTAPPRPAPPRPAPPRPAPPRPGPPRPDRTHPSPADIASRRRG